MNNVKKNALLVRRGFPYPSSDQEFAIRTEILFWPTNTILPHLAFNQDCDNEFGVLHHEFGQFVVGQFVFPLKNMTPVGNVLHLMFFVAIFTNMTERTLALDSIAFAIFTNIYGRAKSTKKQSVWSSLI